MRKSSGIVALLGLLSTVLFAACHPVLGKPAIVGASASSGVGARVPAPGATDQDRRTVPVDLEAVYECVVTAGHQPGVLLATGLVGSDPTRYTQEQIDIALAEDPTCLIALDVLHIRLYQMTHKEVGAHSGGGGGAVGGAVVGAVVGPVPSHQRLSVQRGYTSAELIVGWVR